MDETNHWQFCPYCGTTTEKQAHTLNSLGICAGCGYGCEHRALYVWYGHEIHYFECVDCTHIYDFGVHVDADDDGECDVCKQGSIHILKKVEEVAATCTAQGVKQHYICEACKQTYSDAEGKNLVMDRDLVIAMKLHDYQEGICTVCKGKDPVYVKVEQKDNVPQVNVQIPTQQILTPEEKEAAAAGTEVTVTLTVENADETVDEATKSKVEDVLQKLNGGATPPAGGDQPGPGEPPVGGDQPEQTPAEQPKSETKVAMYLDIDLTKTMGETQTPITETEAKLEIEVAVPASLQNTADNVEREFSVLRLHDGVLDRLEDIDDDPNTVTFETDRFSTYVLIYTDTQKIPEPVTPPTGDRANIAAYTGLMLASLLGLAVVAGKKKYL